MRIQPGLTSMKSSVVMNAGSILILMFNYWTVCMGQCEADITREGDCTRTNL